MWQAFASAAPNAPLSAPVISTVWKTESIPLTGANASIAERV